MHSRFPRIPLKDRVKISQNWQRGRCRKEAVLKWKNKDGKIILHQKQGSFSMEYSAHNQEVWSLSSNRLGECLHTIPTLDRVWSLAISPSQSSFVTGTACCGHVAPLRIWDVESCQLLTCLGTDFRRGAGVLDVVYESPSTLLSCGYDTFIRYWDVRASTRKCVMEWEEPHDSALYCIQSDSNHMIASGSSYYGVVRLWDKRQTCCLQSKRQQSHDRQRLLLLRRGPAVGQAADTLFTGFLTDDLVSHEDNGNQKKYLEVCRLPGPGRRHRRLDSIVVPYSEFACALMHFTGSAHFNRSMRALAKTKTMSLSEHSLNRDVLRKGCLKVTPGLPLPTPAEKDVFTYLGLPYREPQERDW
ncbi:UNVERIFIED_CONTAM: hypothetical protein FKN15_021935 [Acipenser sinensis]